MTDTEREQRITWWCGFGSTLCPYSALLRLLTSFLTCSFPCSLAFAQTLFGVGRFLVKPFVFSQVLVLAVREVKKKSRANSAEEGQKEARAHTETQKTDANTRTHTQRLRGKT